ncbi:hypothetical protein GN956_G6575 [Arapaima gigas]
MGGEKNLTTLTVDEPHSPALKPIGRCFPHQCETDQSSLKRRPKTDSRDTNPIWTHHQGSRLKEMCGRR